MAKAIAKIVFILFFLTVACKNKSKYETENKEQTFDFKIFSEELKANMNDKEIHLQSNTTKENKEIINSKTEDIFNILKDIYPKKLEKCYTESLFYDELNKAAIVNYTSICKEKLIKNIMIMMNNKGDSVHQIFIRKLKREDGQYLFEQIRIEPKKSIETRLEGTPTEIVEKLYW